VSFNDLLGGFLGGRSMAVTASWCSFSSLHGPRILAALARAQAECGQQLSKVADRLC